MFNRGGDGNRLIDGLAGAMETILGLVDLERFRATLLIIGKSTVLVVWIGWTEGAIVGRLNTTEGFFRIRILLGGIETDCFVNVNLSRIGCSIVFGTEEVEVDFETAADFDTSVGFEEVESLD